MEELYYKGKYIMKSPIGDKYYFIGDLIFSSEQAAKDYIEKENEK